MALFARSRIVVFALDGRTPVLMLPHAEALDLLEWLGLGRPEFGAIEVTSLLPLCRRRLWPEQRNRGPMRRHVGVLVQALGARGDGMVHFG
jgi:hypothetical protein